MLLTIIASCTALKSTSESKLRLNREIDLMVSNWDRLVSTVDLSYENIISWLPESGIRGRYEGGKKYLSIAALEEIIGLKVFIKGPHTKGINFKSIADFGYYNPKFLIQLNRILKSIYKHRTFIENTQLLYNSQLKRYLRTLYLSYDIAAENEQIINGYLNAISGAKNDSYENGKISSVYGGSSRPSFYLQESFREFAQSIEREGYDVYEGFTCPGFWIRRSIDGTQNHFYKLLILTMNHYDKEFLEKQQR